MPAGEFLPNLFRTEYRKIVSVLCRRFGFAEVETAEDIASDTFLAAMETWGVKGMPDNPEAWLYRVASNKAVDVLRRLGRRPFLEASGAIDTDEGIDLSLENIRDSQLQMMFAICTPLIPVSAQVALALQLLCGFGIGEIADAFLSNRETIIKRLQRGKDKLREHQVKIEFPADPVRRLQPVLSILYLLFNEGYYSRHSEISVRRELCLEAMRLALLLTEHKDTDVPEVSALLALMCFHASRFDARIGSRGEIVRYEEQDETQWNGELIARGVLYLERSGQGDSAGRYHFEAAIAYWHTFKEDSAEKWANILQLYNQLLVQRYSPVAALNRAYAIGKVYGKKAGIAEAEKLKLEHYSFYHHLLGHWYIGEDDVVALEHLQHALRLARTETERENVRRDVGRIR